MTYDIEAATAFMERIESKTGSMPDTIYCSASTFAQIKWGRKRTVKYTPPTDPRARLRWDRKWA